MGAAVAAGAELRIGTVGGVERAGDEPTTRSASRRCSSGLLIQWSWRSRRTPWTLSSRY